LLAPLNAGLYVFVFGIKDSQKRDAIHLQAGMRPKAARTFYTMRRQNHHPGRPTCPQ